MGSGHETLDTQHAGASVVVMPFDHLSTAAQLLLASAGPRGVVAALENFDAARLDWDLVLALAQRERATAVLWRQLRELDPSPVPEEYRLRFERLAVIARFHASHVESRLRQTLGALASHGVSALLVKGAALALTSYRSFDERPMGDIDLLIPPGDLTRALQAAREAGWVGAEARYPAHRYENHQHLPPLLDATGTTLSLEIHSELFVPGHPFGLSADAVRGDARRVVGLPGEVLVPSPLHSLLHVATHFAWSHLMRFGPWRTIRDVSVLFAGSPELWQQLPGAARAARMASSVYWTLRLARDGAGLEVPPTVLEEMAPYRSELLMRPLARHVALHLLQADPLCPSEWLNALLWRAAIRPRRSGHGASRPIRVPMSSPAVVTPGTIARKVLR